MTYDEIIIKYIQGGLSENISWLIKNLESDIEVVAGTCRKKAALLRFLQGISDMFDEFLEDPESDPRDNDEIFGDEDIIVRPDSGAKDTGTTFLDGPEEKDGGDDDINFNDDKESWEE